MKAASRAELWDQLLAARLVRGATPPPDDDAGTRVLWYIRAMIGIAGWIAAGFLLGFIGILFDWVIDSSIASIIVGLLLIAGAYALFRWAETHAFASQVAVAVSFAGQVLVWIGIEPDLSEQAEWLLIAAFQAALAVVLPNFVLRVWCAGAAAIATAIALFASGAYFLSIGLLAAATALSWLNEFTWPRVNSLVRAIGFGLTLALILVQATAFATETVHGFLMRDEVLSWVPRWMGWLLPGVVLIAVVWQLYLRHGKTAEDKNMIIALLGAAVITAASFKAPGIATGLMLVLLGYSNANKSLVGLGLVALLSYLSAYYYLLESTLLMKSLILAITGAVLLAVRFVVMTQLFPEHEVGHA